MCWLVDTHRRRGNGDYWAVGRVFEAHGSLQPTTAGDIGSWAGYARSWRLVRRCTPLRKKAYQSSVDLSYITRKSSPKHHYQVNQQARFGIIARRRWFHNRGEREKGTGKQVL